MGAAVADDPEMKPLRCSLQTCVCVVFCCQRVEMCPRIICSPCWGFALVFLTRDEVIFESALSSELRPFPLEIPTFNFHSRNPSVLQLVLSCCTALLTACRHQPAPGYVLI